MDAILSKVTQQAMNYAIRTGITITSGFALQQYSRLLKSVRGSERTELAALQMRLESKIRIISPAIDMIELIAARGNTSLESAVTLTKALRWDIQELGVRLSKAAADEELSRRGSARAKSTVQNEFELNSIMSDIKQLLIRIEDAVPLISLAITTSGVSLSTTLPDTVSPSRLLQASTLLTAGDSQYAADPTKPLQICPDFTLSMYMLFSGHASRPQDIEGIRETTWKEVMHKARLKILRVPVERVDDYPGEDGTTSQQQKNDAQNNMSGEQKAFEYAYQLLIIEDLDDGRVHTFDDENDGPSSYEGVDNAGLRELIPVHQISKIFYADTGKILNIGTEGETNNPVLLLKRDINAVPPRRMMQTSPKFEYPDDSPSPEHDEQSEVDEQLFRESPAPQSPKQEYFKDNPRQPSRTLPHDLDPEWIAFEVYVERFPDDDSDAESDLASSKAETITPQRTPRSPSAEPSLMSAFSRFNTRGQSSPSSPSPQSPPTNPLLSQIVLSPQKTAAIPPTPPTAQLPIPAIRTSLSLLEMLIRLTALQQFQQMSHLAIPDELLTFFLSESSTVGAGGNAELRQRVRRDARRRVGFDPYDESPIKRRGEEYLGQSYTPNRPRYGDSPNSLEFNDSRYSPRSPSLPAESPLLLQSTPYHPSPPSPSPSYQPASSPGTYVPDEPIPSQELRHSHNCSSPSPLLRRATALNNNYQRTNPANQRTNYTATTQNMLPFMVDGPPTAPATSSSPRVLHVRPQVNMDPTKPSTPDQEGQGRGSVRGPIHGLQTPEDSSASQ